MFICAKFTDALCRHCARPFRVVIVSFMGPSSGRVPPWCHATPHHHQTRGPHPRPPVVPCPPGRGWPIYRVGTPSTIHLFQRWHHALPDGASEQIPCAPTIATLDTPWSCPVDAPAPPPRGMVPWPTDTPQGYAVDGSDPPKQNTCSPFCVWDDMKRHPRPPCQNEHLFPFPTSGPEWGQTATRPPVRVDRTFSLPAAPYGPSVARWCHAYGVRRSTVQGRDLVRCPLDWPPAYPPRTCVRSMPLAWCNATR